MTARGGVPAPQRAFESAMIRSIALAAIAGALVAAGGFYALSSSALRYNVAAQAPAPDAPANAVTENWPICTTMNAMGSEADLSGLDPDFAAGKKALGADDWNGAIAALKLAALRDPRNADIQNYIGYAYRRLRQLGPAMGHYQQALAFNPRHRSAHAHLGELYLVLREPSGAERHLAALEEICLIPCVEIGDLERAIASYKGAVTR
jgi:tetratricopeptide (TPR) repeat protein